MEATAVPVLRQSLSLSASTVVCDPMQLAEQRRWRSRSRQDESHTHLLGDADVRSEGGEIGVGDEQEDAVVSRQLQLGRRHGCPAAVLRR